MAFPPKLPEFIPPVATPLKDSAEIAFIAEKDIAECEQRYLAWRWANPGKGERERKGPVPKPTPKEKETRRTTAETKQLPDKMYWDDQRRELARLTIAPDRIRPPGGEPARAYDEFVYTGIGLSGGGIRSATFCLGILQALAAHDLLRHFDYISTVSGGGYLGASLRWLWRNLSATAAASQVAGGTSPHDFPYGSEDPDPLQRRNAHGYLGSSTGTQTAQLDYLRTHGNYLAPGNGITFFSGLAVVIRTIMLNLFVWIPVSAAVFIGLLYFRTELINFANDIALINPIGFLIDAAWAPTPALPHRQLPVMFALLIWAAIGLAIWFMAYSIAYALFSILSHDSSKGKVKSGLLLVVAVLFVATGFRYFNGFSVEGSEVPVSLLQILSNGAGLLAIAIGILVTIVAILTWKAPNGTDGSYHLRRKFETMFGFLFVPFLLCLMIGFIPVLANFVQMNPLTKIAGVALGIIAVIRGQYASLKNFAPSFADNIFLPFGAAVVLLVALIIGYFMAQAILFPQFLFVDIFLPSIRTILVAAIMLALVLSIFTNTNQTGLHRYYRDRLLEAFMPDNFAVLRKRTTASPDADSFKLYDAWPHDRSANIPKDAPQPTYQELPQSSEVAPADLPYLLVNTNVILINDDDNRIATRGGDNYILSPIYCGSNATGWVRTQHPICRKLTLASAMAASGAAANSNSGYVGGGLTRSTLISIVMMFLNIRLGYWVPNPNDHNVKRRIWRNPNHWYPGFFYSVLKKGYKRDSGFLELSDGGHFENLGLYELVRRRCRVIVICDGEADKQTAYLALVSAIRRIEEDFGATVEFIPKKGPERLVASLEMGYPADAKQSAASYLVARINYRDGTHSVILYLKAAITENASFRVKGYKGANPDFPHEATADQFFDPVQFEAYRELGYRAARSMVADLQLDTVNIGNWKTIWQNA